MTSTVDRPKPRARDQHRRARQQIEARGVLPARVRRQESDGRCRPDRRRREWRRSPRDTRRRHRMAERAAIRRNRARRRRSTGGLRPADADRSRCPRELRRRSRACSSSAPRPPAIASATSRSSGVVIFTFVDSPSTSRTGWPARSASDASSVASTPVSPRASASRSTSRRNACGRLRQEDRLPRQRFHDVVSAVGRASPYPARPAPPRPRPTLRRLQSFATRDRRSRMAAQHRARRSHRSLVAALNPLTPSPGAARRQPPPAPACAPTRYGGGLPGKLDRQHDNDVVDVGMIRGTGQRYVRATNGRRSGRNCFGTPPPKRWPRPPAANDRRHVHADSGLARTRLSLYRGFCRDLDGCRRRWRGPRSPTASRHGPSVPRSSGRGNRIVNHQPDVGRLGLQSSFRHHPARSDHGERHDRQPGFNREQETPRLEGTHLPGRASRALGVDHQRQPLR